MTTEADAAAQAFLEFMTSTEAQADYAQSGFRPVVDGVDVGEVEGANDPSDPFPTPEQLRRVLRLANIPCADGASQEETR